MVWEKWTTPADSSFFLVGIRFLAEAIECMDVPRTKKEKIGRGSGSMGEEVKRYGVSFEVCIYFVTARISRDISFSKKTIKTC